MTSQRAHICLLVANWDEHQTGVDRWNKPRFHSHLSPTTTEKLYLTPNILMKTLVFAIMKSNIPISQLDFHTGFVRWWFDKNTAVRISVTISFLLVVLFVITGGCFCCCCCCCKPCKKRSENRVV